MIDPFEALEQVRDESRRAVIGLAEKRVQNGATSLTRIYYMAEDALIEAHEAGLLDYDAESASMP